MSGSWPAEMVTALETAMRALDEPFDLDRALDGIVEAALLVCAGERVVLMQHGCVLAERAAFATAPTIEGSHFEQVIRTGRSFGPAGLDGLESSGESSVCALPVCATSRSVLAVRLNGCPMDAPRWSALRHLSGLAAFALARAQDAVVAGRFRATAERAEQLEARAARRRKQRIAGEESEIAFKPILGSSDALLDHLAQLDRAASEANVILLTGPTGSGKELSARAIHALVRPKGPFVVRNVSSFRGDRLGSEVFGHVKGAFTGAVANARGAFEQAHQGVLFLDELQSLDRDGQDELMRVVEDRIVRPLGGDRDRAVDVIIVCATNRDLRAMVAAGEFREDLYFRLAGRTVRVPSLDERREDIPLLVHAWLGKGQTPYAAEEDAMAYLVAARWDGGIRQLRHVVSAAFDSRTGLLSAARVAQEYVRSSGREEVPTELTEIVRQIDDLERLRVLRALQIAKGCTREAAALLGLTPNGLRKKAKRLGIRLGRRT